MACGKRNEAALTVHVEAREVTDLIAELIMRPRDLALRARERSAKRRMRWQRHEDELPDVSEAAEEEQQGEERQQNRPAAFAERILSYVG